MPMPSSTYFSRALSRLVRSPRSMNTRTMASATLVASAGLTMMPVSLAKSLWPVMPPMPEPKPDAGLDAETVLHLDGGKRDVVGVFQHRDLAGAVEGDVELARQARQRAVVEDVIVPLAGIFAGVEQFLRIDPGGRRARDVADVVGAGAARAQAEILNALDQRHRMLRRDFADLQIGARGDVAERPAQLLGEIGQSRRTASASGCRSESAAGTCRNPAPARHRTGRNSASGNYPPATAARCRAPAASAADRHRTDAPRA